MMHHKTEEELKNAFFPLMTIKSPGYNDTDISFNAINNVFDFIVELLRYIFNNSLAQIIFPDEMEMHELRPYTKVEKNQML